MKNKLLKHTLYICICIVISILIEVLYFNYNAIFNNIPSENIDFSTTTQDGNAVLNLNLDSQYINKLIINYDATKDIEYSLRYSSQDLFGEEKENIIKDIFDDSFNTSTTNIRNYVSNIAIEYASSEATNLNIRSLETDNDFQFNLTRAFSIFLVLILFYCLIVFYKNRFKTEKFHIYFAVVGTILGTIIILAQPSSTFYSYDDQIHFQNAVDLFSIGDTTYSVGEYHSTEANVANSAGRGSVNSIEEQQAQNNLFDSGSSTYSKTVKFAPTYNKIGYIPMSLGYHLAKFANLPFSICFKIGKFFNLLFYILLIAYTIKTIKIGKRLLAIIALLPTSIFLASEYSYDPAVFIGLTIFIAQLVNLYLDKNTKFDFKTAVILFASISYACFVKAIYVPFFLLTLLVPKEKFDTPKQARLVKAGTLALTILLSATFVLPTISGTMESDSRGGSTSVSGQLTSMLSHPTDYIKLLGNTAVAQFSDKVSQGFDDLSYIYNEAKRSSSNFFYILLILLLFVSITDNTGNSLSKKHRLSILIASLVTSLLIWTALYITFTPVGDNTINGVQSRYFLPLLFPLLICLQPKNIKNSINPRLYNTIILTIPVIINIITIFTSIVAVYSY